MEFTSAIGALLEVGLAPVLVILLLWKGFDLLNKYNDKLFKELLKTQIGLRLILEKLNATKEYEDAIREMKERGKS